MVSQKFFESYPPFPDDVPIAKVSKISFKKLVAGDEAEALRMFEACRKAGFFLLDLKDELIGDEFIQIIDTMFGVVKELFDLSPEEKAKYSLVLPHKLLGYKAVGVAKTETGEPDKCESWGVGQDDLLKAGPGLAKDNPEVIVENRETFISFLDHADPIVRLILSILDTQLGLPAGKLSSLQRRDQPSGTNIRMIQNPPQDINERRTSMVQHTDFGTLTLLCNVLGGLQILEQDPSSNAPGKWCYVKPNPNCVIVNFGDALVEWTGGIIRSGLHRVTYAPGKQATCTRQSIAYLVRPETSAPMKRLTGGYIPVPDENENEMDLTAWEWEVQKTVALRDGTEIVQSKGGREFGKFSTQTPMVAS